MIINSIFWWYNPVYSSIDDDEDEDVEDVPETTRKPKNGKGKKGKKIKSDRYICIDIYYISNFNRPQR